jgi:hypothetical protein
MIALRRILFFVFVGLYFAFCPALVSHVLKILRTGLIEVISVPVGATVTLNGRTLSDKTPLRIPKLSAGEYQLSVSAPGHQAWTNSVLVDEGTVVRLNRVLLLPDKPAVRVLTRSGFDRLIALERSHFLLLTATDDVDEWRLFDRRKETLQPLLPANSPMADIRIEEVFTAPKSPQFVLRATRDGTARYLRVNTAAEPPRIDDLSKNFPEPPERVLWDAAAPDVLFVMSQGKVRKIDLRLGSDYPNFGTGWRGLGVFDQRVFWMDGEARIGSMEFDKSSRKMIFDDPKTGLEIFGPTGEFLILPLDSETILFLGENGRLYQSGLPNLLVEQGVRGVRGAEKPACTLVWTAHKIGILHTSTGAAADKSRRFKQGRQVSWAYDAAEDIGDAWHIDGGSHAVLINGGRIELLELFPGMHAQPRTVIEVKPRSGLCADGRWGVVYALDQEQGRLISIQLAPPQSTPAIISARTRRPP